MVRKQLKPKSKAAALDPLLGGLIGTATGTLFVKKDGGAGTAVGSLNKKRYSELVYFYSTMLVWNCIFAPCFLETNGTYP